MDKRWEACPDVARDAGRMSGAWTIRDASGNPTRIRVEDILANAAPELSAQDAADQIVHEVYPSGLSPERVARVIEMARTEAHASHSA
jgi:uncharacterized protein (DUF433 family)